MPALPGESRFSMHETMKLDEVFLILPIMGNMMFFWLGIVLQEIVIFFSRSARG